MPRSEVDAVVEKNLRFRVSLIRLSEEELVMYAPVGITADSLTLNMRFSNQKLISAKIVGEDNPLDVPKDAPPDLP
jgi:hypothetical protein